MKLLQATYDIGKGVTGQSITLIHRAKSNGQLCWDIHAAPADQRDNTQVITGLTDENLAEIAAVYLSAEEEAT